MTKLNEITELITKGTTPTTIGGKFEDSGINFIKSEQINNCRKISIGNCFISDRINDKMKRSQLKENDILVSIAGAYLGKLGICSKRDLPANTNQAVGIVRLKNNINYLYIYYYLGTRSVQNYIKNCNAQSAQPNINLEQLGNIQLDLPPISFQHHIVDTIGSVDDLIEKNEEIIEKLEEYSNKLYNQYNLLSGNATEKLGKYCEIKTGKLNANAASEDGKYKFFTCSHNELKISTYSFDCEAIILSGNGELEAKYYKGKFDAYQRTYVLCPNKYFFLFFKECQNQILNLKASSKGSVIKFITKEMIEKIEIRVNNSSDIYNRKLETIYNQISNYKIKNETLLLIKQLLLNKYFD